MVALKVSLRFICACGKSRKANAQPAC